MLPRDPILGPFRVLEVYESYDGPRLFSAENAAGHRYLCVWLGAQASSERWLYVPISNARLDLLRRGTLDLRSAFAEPEGNEAIRAETDRVTGAVTVERLEASRLSDAELPEPGETLSDEPLTDDPRFANRELVHLALEFPDKRTEAPLTVLGVFLHALQKTIDAIGEALAGQFEGLQPVANILRQRTALALAETFPSSFGMRVTSSAPPELFAESLVSLSVAEFVALVSAGADEEELRALLTRLHRRTALRYGALLKFVSGAGADLRVHWRAGRARTTKRASLSCANAARAVAIIRKHEDQNPIEIIVVGVLTKISVPPNTRTFRLDLPAEERSYSGIISEEGMATAGHATINNTYRAKIREIPEASPVTEEITFRYELLSLAPVTS